MVHALNEIQRVLVPEGILIDLRPLADQWRVEVVSARETRLTGHLTDLPLGLDDDRAANRAMAEAKKNGWFQHDREEFFPLYYIWDTAAEMEEWIDTEWEGYLALQEQTRRATRSAWALGDADSRVRVEIKMLITRWRRL